MTSINRGRRAVGAAAVLVLVIGASGLAAAIAQSSVGGYFTTPAGSFRTTTSVLLTDEIDVGTGLPADPEPDLGELGRIRVHVEAADPATHLFIGIGNRDAVHDYLDGTAHDEFTGATSNPFHASFDRVPGAETVTAPGAQPFWVAQSTGGSDTTLEWDKTAGPWSLIVANADGRPGLDVRADLGLRFGFLAPLGAALLATGGLLLVAAFAGRPSRPRAGPGAATISTTGRWRCSVSAWAGRRADPGSGGPIGAATGSRPPGTRSGAGSRTPRAPG